MGQGPLSDLKVLEFAGIGPGPFCGMLLSDLGADVVRIDRKGPGRGSKTDVTGRGRKSVAMDLKSPAAVEACLKLMETADAVFEGFRPGVMERLGLGPDVALARNPKLVFGRMTGWGQTGPYALAAGHDINYIAISGALSAIGTAEKPVPPLNLVGDFGGGALYLAFGLLAGVVHARSTRSGTGDRLRHERRRGVAHGDVLRHEGRGGVERRPSRATCSTAARTSTAPTNAPTENGSRWAPSSRNSMPCCWRRPASTIRRSRRRWTAASGRRCTSKLAAVIASKTRDEWCEIMDGTDVCFGPGAQPRRGAAARAQRCTPDLRRGRWRRPAGARATLLRHARRHRRTAAGHRRRQPHGPRRLGVHRRRNRGLGERRRSLNFKLNSVHPRFSRTPVERSR